MAALSSSPLPTIRPSIEVPPAIRQELLSLSEKYPPAFLRRCRRVTSKKGRSIERLFYLTIHGVLLILTVDGSKGKRVENLTSATCVHSVFVSPQPASSDPTASVFGGQVTFWFQGSKDLALEFPKTLHPSDPVDATYAKLVTLLTATATVSSSLFDLSYTPSPLSKALQLSSSFHGHGKPSESGVVKEGAASSPPLPSAVPQSSAAPAAQVEKVTMEAIRPKKRSSSVASHSSPSGPNLRELVVSERSSDNQEDPLGILGVHLQAEEYLLKLENEDAKEDIAWMTDMKQRALRKQLALDRIENERQEWLNYAEEQLNILLTCICRKQLQKRQHAHVLEYERRLQRQLQQQRLLRHPDRLFLTMGGDHSYVDTDEATRLLLFANVSSLRPSQHNNTTSVTKYVTGASPKRVSFMTSPRGPDLGSPAALLTALTQPHGELAEEIELTRSLGREREAVLSGSRGRMTRLGQPLHRSYDAQISDLL